jgi:hypothetical protein
MAKLSLSDQAKTERDPMQKTTMIMATLVALAMATGGIVQAQDRVEQLLAAGKPKPELAAGAADGQATNTEQDPAELRATQALNAEITARNDLAQSQERADQAAFAAERARWEERQALNAQARLDWEASMRANDEARRRWEADRARWEADVRACQAGDRSRCAPQ